MQLAQSYIGIMVIAFAVGCGESSFTGPAGTASSTKDQGRVDAAVGSPTTEVFQLAQEVPDLDLVWVIDNSPSMTDEHRIVQKNFEGFVANLQHLANVRLALLSFGEGDLGVNLSEKLKAKGHVQISHPVASTNPLALVASAVCPASQTDPYVTYPDAAEGRMKFCGRMTESRGPGDALESPITVEQVKGSLAGFFRDGARKTFVFVTDDNAAFVTDKNFLPLLQSRFGKEKPVIHAFQAQSNATCDVAAVGTAYQALAAATGGLTFDICAKDWSEHFTKLTAAMGGTRKADFKLASERDVTVTGVEVDGSPIDASAYSVSGQTIRLDPEVIAKGAEKITVTYLESQK